MAQDQTAHMMGTLPEQRQPEFFAYHIDLERRVRPEHPLRQIKTILDLSFVLPLVKDSYGRCGHTSVDPRVIIKLMILLFYYDVASERELLEQLPERLDWLWFLGLDLESEIPHHSVLSKARARWGTELFEALFIRSVEQCVKAGLVNGRLLHADSTTITANASKDSVVKSSPELVRALRQAYQKEEQKLTVLPQQNGGSSDSPETVAPQSHQKTAPKEVRINQTHVSRTDPQAELARTKTGRTELSYKEHRLVDDAHGVITGIITTPGSVGDAGQLAGLIQQHQSTTGLKVDSLTVAADHHYGSANNYLYCAEQGLRAHLAPSSAQLKARGKLPLEDFTYEAQADRLRCPAGHYLVLHQHRPQEQAKVYRIEKAQLCANCPLRAGCTDSPRGRTLQRHLQSQLLEELRAEAQSAAARYSRKRRKHVMEGSFADGANNHGLKRSRWRGLWRQRIQGWIIAAVQNLRLLLRKLAKPTGQAAVNVQVEVSSVGQLNGKSFARKCAWAQARWGLWIAIHSGPSCQLQN
jgi:transposase